MEGSTMNKAEERPFSEPLNEMPAEIDLDTMTLDRKSFISGLLKFLLFTSIAVLVFFIPIEINGNSEILFGFFYKSFINLFGIAGVWIVTFVVIANAVASCIGKFVAKEGSSLHTYYARDTKIHVVFYVVGAIYSLLYTLHIGTSFNGPEAIVGANTGGLMSDISLAVFWVIPLGAIFIPLFINFGAIDFVGTIVEPIMRPIFKVPGKSAVDAIASFITSSSVAVLITSKLYKGNVYTKKEAMMIATSFSAVSVGYAAVVINTAGLMEHFAIVYFPSLIIAFVISFIMVRIPPISRMENQYFSGRAQSAADLSEAKFHRKIFSLASSRAIKQAHVSDSIVKEAGKSLMDGLSVLPKVLAMLFAVGVTCLIAAEYTPIFDWLGMLFVPFLQLFQIPNAVDIAPALMLGIAEMFLPVLMIADSIDTIDIGARYFVTVVSMVQIIFFAETGAVMISTGLPVKVWQLIVIFFLRTIVAIPIVALCMHLIF